MISGALTGLIKLKSQLIDGRLFSRKIDKIDSHQLQENIVFKITNAQNSLQVLSSLRGCIVSPLPLSYSAPMNYYCLSYAL